MFLKKLAACQAIARRHTPTRRGEHNVFKENLRLAKCTSAQSVMNFYKRDARMPSHIIKKDDLLKQTHIYC